MRRTRCRTRTRQHELEFRSWGGARRGAGRKPANRPRTPHRARPAHAARFPLHVTVHLRDGLPTLRTRSVRAAVVDALADGNERFGFRLNQFSLQTNHLHLIAEAKDASALSRGMQAVLVRVARALNRVWDRRGSVFSGRYHARPLRTPREVRRALVYVLTNARHHGSGLAGIDPFSSGLWFDGWRQNPAAGSSSPCVQANTWLLQEGWRRHGPIGVEESPSAR
jgi:REP-associated tyrosine transposase